MSNLTTVEVPITLASLQRLRSRLFDNATLVNAPCYTVFVHPSIEREFARVIANRPIRKHGRAGNMRARKRALLASWGGRFKLTRHEGVDAIVT